MTDEVIKRLREYATGKRVRGFVYGQVTVAELLALLEIAESAQRVKERRYVYSGFHSQQVLHEDMDALCAALSNLSEATSAQKDKAVQEAESVASPHPTEPPHAP